MLDLMLYAKIVGAGAAATGLISLFKEKETKGNLATSKILEAEHLENLLGNDGIRLSKTIQLNKNKTKEHILVVGATGEHKTTSLFFPNLLTEDLKGSIIVIDPKRELFDLTSHYQESIGRRAILFSPLNAEESLQYNLLKECKNNTEVKELAEIILINSTKALELQTGTKANGVEWLNMAKPLFVACLLYVKEKGSPLDTITNAARMVIDRTTEELELLLTSTENEAIEEQFNIFKSCLESPKTASSIKITLNSALQLFLDEKLIATTKKSEFNGKTLREKPTCLYISYPENKSSYLSPFMATFFTQLINNLMETKGEDITLLCDEFANIGMINDFKATISTCRSRGLGFLICLQSTSQLVQTYGEHNAKTILNNLKTKCILPSLSDIATLRYMSELLGECEVVIKNTSQTEKRKSESFVTSKKRLMSADEIRRLESGEILIIAHNKQAVKDKQNIYYVNKDYTSKIKNITE